MKFRVSYVTHTGMVRKQNQDSLLVQKTLVTKASMAAPAILDFEADTAWFLVADGMGGEARGDEASRETLRVFAERLPAMTQPNGLADLLDLARKRLEEIAQAHQCRLGTTLAGLIVTPAGCVVFNVGDCRVYKVRAGFLNRLTRDHSLLEEATAAGKPPGSVPQNFVTSAVMGGDPSEMPVFSKAIQVKGTDQYLICCDGLWGALPIEEMEGAFINAQPQEALDTLLRLALPKSDDNISAIVVQVI